jgi:hypothetical protein
VQLKAPTAATTAGLVAADAVTSVKGTADMLAGGSYKYSYTVALPAGRARVIDAWSLTVGGAITAVSAPRGWASAVTVAGTATSILFFTNAAAPDATGVDPGAVRPGTALAGFSFVSTVSPTSVPYRTSSPSVVVPVSEAEAEDLGLAGAPPDGVEDGLVIGPAAKPIVLAASPRTLNFAVVHSATATPLGTTAPQTVRLSQSGPGGPVAWTAQSDQSWLHVSPRSGAGDAVLTLSVTDPAVLTAPSSALRGTVVITADDASNTPTVAVTLTVLSPSATRAPFGAFDTPLDQTNGVTGSIAVTGWALDDLQMSRVRILRAPLPGEGTGLVFIGNATFVDGARPDVAAAYPATPRNTRAGWGYLMLTNFLPAGGNGTYKLYAYADAAAGKSTLLGTKTIVCNNRAATTPFGAIDTPEQGATVSGLVSNFGWVLSPGTRRADPLHGGVVNVLIDGAVVGSPSAWVSRPDLAALFPANQFSGVSNALGLFGLDTTRLTNGVHTIAWVVTDSQNGTAGIGSRFFTVSNGAGLAVAATRLASLSSESIDGRQGPDLFAPFQPLSADTDGVLTVQAEQLDRIEVRVHATAGRERTPRGDRPLPVGSALDPTDGTFTWQPGPSFLGRYELVFDTPEGTRRIRVILSPQGSRTHPQLVIELPSQGSDTTGSFTVAGWALDPNATSDTGIDAIHVWAYPARGSAPIFLGAATLDGRRPDVAAIYGERFTASGYGLLVDGLAPGTYDVAVFAHSLSTGDFLPARVVRVTVR